MSNDWPEADLATERRARAEVEAVLERVRVILHNGPPGSTSGYAHADWHWLVDDLRAALDTPRPTALREFAADVARAAAHITSTVISDGYLTDAGAEHVADRTISRLLPDNTEGGDEGR